MLVRRAASVSSSRAGNGLAGGEVPLWLNGSPLVGMVVLLVVRGRGVRPPVAVLLPALLRGKSCPLGSAMSHIPVAYAMGLGSSVTDAPVVTRSESNVYSIRTGKYGRSPVKG